MKRPTLLSFLLCPASKLVFASALLVSAGCGSDADEAPRVLARPVTVLELEAHAPPPGRLIPGVVTPYRQTELPFEVGGRVERLIGVGDDVQGEQLDRDGNVVQAGAVMAELDPAPLQRALNQTRQTLQAARLQLEAQVVQLEDVLPARLASARSQAQAAELSASYAKDDVAALESAVELAATTLERNQGLLPTGAVSDIAVRQSATELEGSKARLAQSLTLVTTREREYDAAVSTVAEIEGSIALQRANNEAQRASIRGFEEAVLDAESDLQNCTLRAPFPGRVTRLHVGEGSFVAAGSPVLTLTMMNPIETVINVSAGVEEELIVGTDALIYPMNASQVDMESAVRATLFQKRGVADSGTRTFEVGLIAPNRRRVVRADQAGLPVVPYLMPVFDNPLDLPGGEGLYTVAEAVERSGDEAWVLKVRGLAQGARSEATLKGKLEATRVPVRAGDRIIQIASWSLVELVEASGLTEGDLLVPLPTPAHADGFIVDDNRWLLRPGDLVQVAVSHGDLPAGFYLPVQSIRELNGSTSVFVVGPDERVRAVVVEVRETSGELRRVVSDELADGDAVVASGAHFLQDGDRVAVTGTVSGAGQ